MNATQPENRTMNEERCWQAVIDRDGSMDDTFVYGVRSTGVYCRPSCPSRRPRREQVTFSVAPGEAEAAGFRACLRCKPNGNDTPSAQTRMVEQARRYIEENIDGESALTLEAIGKHLGVSPFHLQRVFKRIAGVTPRQYASALRMERFKEGLRNGNGSTVTEAMYDAGYGSSSRLYETAPAALGMTPDRYRRGGEGMEIEYTIAECSLGKLLVGATEHGVCAVSLGDTDEELERALRTEYHAAHITRSSRDSERLGPWVQMIAGQLEGREPVRLPVDVAASPFQQRVWQELRKIPYGTTRSYGQVAKAIGQPSAVRAVARACGANHVALVIPCHRVVREDGDLGGYKWGVERKKALLEGERRNA
jgi:AraC family transcriptional regulator, regulatory protein of adaptative response / methylated-DNA-[protein]-cysteine methyltransferase